MATYYRWVKSAVNYKTNRNLLASQGNSVNVGSYPSGFTAYCSRSYTNDGTTISLQDYVSVEVPANNNKYPEYKYCIINSPNGQLAYESSSAWFQLSCYLNGLSTVRDQGNGGIYGISISMEKTFDSYVYSTSASAYPNGGVSGSYYYDQRTTITSPTAPSGLTYPNPITTPPVNVSWSASVSNVPAYSISTYEVSYATNGGSNWTVANTTASTSLSVDLPAGATSVQFRVRAKDSNGQWGGYVTGTTATVLLAPTITVPSQSMQGQNITVNWTAVDTATSYTLQRKANTDDGWVQVYSGNALTFTETVGAWTSVQYQVQAVFSSGAGGWATSTSIPVASASALVISGTDEDLGTITADIPYTVSTDTGNQISLTRTVNGVLVASLTVENGFAYNIPVMDLPTGTGTIVISATVQATSGPVTATRTWTYTKSAFSFPGTGSTAQLQQEGKNMFPATLAECVRASKLWGGSLDKALEMLGNAVTYTATAQPKYSEVTVSLAEAQVGDIVNLPYNGEMVPHIVVQVGNPDAEMYDSSCDGVWILRKDCVAQGQWNTINVNTLDGSTIMTTLQGYVENYDTTVSSQIKTVKIPYCVGNGSDTVQTLESGLECKMFPLSGYEFGWTQEDYGGFPVDGAALSYFKNLPVNSEKRGFLFNGKKVATWTRSPYTGNQIYSMIADASGGFAITQPASMNYYLNCFILPSTFSATYFVDQAGTIHAEQEYTTAGDFADLWGNTIPVPKIETGSYVGTGTYGQSSPNTLTFSFEPKLVWIYAASVSNNDLASCGAILSSQIKIPPGATYSFPITASATQSYGAFTGLNFDGKAVSWYGNTDTAQLNRTDWTYFYFAIG